MDYVLPPLPYGYDALEPFIDCATMKIHHLGHHKAYVDKLNSLMGPLSKKRIETLITDLTGIPESIRKEVHNNAGGHANHSLFWTMLSIRKQEPSGEFLKVLRSTFGNVGNFKTHFTEAAQNHFSNGWAWLCVNSGRQLFVTTTHDHESPVVQGHTPLFILDLWEHAYYLKHQNRRAEYIDAFWHTVNWSEVSDRWDEYAATGTTHREWRLAG